MPNEKEYRNIYQPVDLDFSKVYTPSSRKSTTPTRKQDHAGEDDLQPKSDFIPQDKILGSQGKKDSLDGTARPATRPRQFTPDIDFDKLTGSGK